jgi:hypothetical protein
MSRTQLSPASHSQQQASILNSHCSEALAKRYDNILSFIFHSFPRILIQSADVLIGKCQNRIYCKSIIIKSYSVSSFTWHLCCAVFILVLHTSRRRCSRTNNEIVKTATAELVRICDKSKRMCSLRTDQNNNEQEVRIVVNLKTSDFHLS